MVAVWPDTRIKSGPIFSKVAPKSNQSSFYIKREFFRLHIKLPNIWANFASEYVSKTFQK